MFALMVIVARYAVGLVVQNDSQRKSRRLANGKGRARS